MSNKVFKQHPRLKRYYETTDGTKFFDEGLAKNHAKTLKEKEVKTVKKGKNLEDKPNPMLAAKLRGEAISKMDTVAEVEKALEGETAKTVKEAGEARIEQLKLTENPE